MMGVLKNILIGIAGLLVIAGGIAIGLFIEYSPKAGIIGGMISMLLVFTYIKAVYIEVPQEDEIY
jgi:hypothetical protein